MFYTGAPQNTFRSKINEELTQEAFKLMKNNNVIADKIICHAPYIINLANNLDPAKYQFSMHFLRSEMNRCISLGVKYLVLHPGSAVKIKREVAIDNIVFALNNIIKKEDDITILLETMAGKGTEIGINTNELKYIIDNIKIKDKIGVCIDTCHLNDSGVNLNYFDEYLEEFNNLIGISKIKCVHINDSKNQIGDKKDRHANIGFGTIGFNTLLKIIYHDKLKGVPKILETPWLNEKPLYKEELDMIKNKKFNPNIIAD